MSDQKTPSERLDDGTKVLANLAQAISDAYHDLSEAEDAWEEVWDEVAVQLKAEMEEDGRKGDPAEHVIKSATRRAHRDVYRRWRTAKREVAKLEVVSQNRRQETSSLQSLLKIEGGESKPMDTQSAKRQSPGAAARQAAERRAA
jgi:hypothetical protein